jgi:hypothetical protein
VVLAHHVLQLEAVVAPLAELLGDALDVGEGVVDVVGDVGELLGEAVVALGEQALGLLAGDVGEGVVGVAAADAVVAVERLLGALPLLVGDGVVGEGVGALEAHLRQEALVVAQRAPAERHLLDPVRNHHVEQSLRPALDVVGQHHLAPHVPRLQVVGARSQQVIILVEGHAGDGHGLAARAPHQLPALAVEPRQSVEAAHCGEPGGGGEGEEGGFELVEEERLHHPEVEGAEEAVLSAREQHSGGGGGDGVHAFLVGLHVGDRVLGAQVPQLDGGVRRPADEEGVRTAVGGERGDLDGVPLERAVDWVAGWLLLRVLRSQMLMEPRLEPTMICSSFLLKVRAVRAEGLLLVAVAVVRTEMGLGVSTL